MIRQDPTRGGPRRSALGHRALEHGAREHETPRPDPADVRRLEPASTEEFDVTASGDALGVSNPLADGGSPARDELWLSFLLDGTWEPVGLRVRRRSRAMLELRLSCPASECDRAVEQARRMLSLDADAAEFAAVTDRDPYLRALRRERPGMRPILFGSPYEAACWALICQGLRTRQAVAAVGKLAARHGRLALVAGRPAAVLPAPDVLRDLGPATGLSAEKRRRLGVLADAADAGLLDAAGLRAMGADSAMALLRQLPGIGGLSAELIVARGAGHPDVLPAHDRLLTPVLRELYTREPDWEPYRSWASFLLREHVVRNEHVRRTEAERVIAGSYDRPPSGGSPGDGQGVTGSRHRLW